MQGFNGKKIKILKWKIKEFPEKAKSSFNISVLHINMANMNRTDKTDGAPSHQEDSG